MIQFDIRSISELGFNSKSELLNECIIQENNELLNKCMKSKIYMYHCCIYKHKRLDHGLY